MKRFFSIFLCLLLLLTLAVPAFAGNTIILNYEPWLFFYDLTDSEENHDIWLGMYSYGGSEELYPSKLSASETSGDVESETPGDGQSVTDESVLPDGDPISDDIYSESDPGYREAVVNASGSESSLSQYSTPVPSSSQSYILPEVVSVEYAPDASAGSLLAVLYGLLGKPVTSYTYKVQTGYNNSQTGYITQQLDYDANWIASVVLLIVVLFCIFKAGGALLCKA